MNEGVDAGCRGKSAAEQYQQEISGRPCDQARDHCFAPSEKPFSAAFRLLSASIRKLAERTIASPSSTPCRTSTYPEPRCPSLTSRGSKRPSPLSINTACRVPLSSTELSGTASTG